MKLTLSRFQSMFKFLAAGLPAFLLAVPLNWCLVDWLGLPKPLAYLLVLLFQVSVNYLMCKAFVFRTTDSRVSFEEYLKFMSGILVFRVVDWVFYVAMVSLAGVHYLVAQLLNVVIFSFAKFFFAEKVLSGGAEEDVPGVEKKPRRNRWPAVGLWAILILAFLFRSYGISHDLDLGKGYHPDTAKQVRMAERYAKGVFYYEVGGRDYDGYPYFNSLLAAGVYRVVMAVGEAGHRHLGLHTSSPMPTVILLDWIIRYMNVAISTLGVWVFHLLARRLGGPRVALWSALVMALSPLDIAACHYASGDSAAGFFVTLSLLFSVRIHQEGRMRDYVLAAAACMCAFSAKYHGAMVASGLIVAHALRAKSVREWFGGDSLRRVLVVLLTVVAVFLLTNPATLVRMSRGIEKIVEFLQFSAQFGQRDETIRAMTPAARWMNSVRMNIPVFADFLSPVFLGLALLGVVRSFFWRKEWLVISLLPILYAAVGISAKTADNAVYSTIVTPPLLLLAVLMVDEVMRFRICRPIPRVVGWSALLVGTMLLGNAAYREMFFFWNHDTRVLAERWVKENVPAGYAVTGGRYTALDASLADRPGAGPGHVYLQADPRDRQPGGTFLINRFWLEDRPLPLFRNWPVDVFVSEGTGIRPSWSLPLDQQIPSAFDTDLVYAGARDLWRSPRIFMIDEGRPALKSLLSREPLDEALVVVTAGHIPTRVKVSVGGREAAWFLESGQTVWRRFEKLHRRLPLLAGLHAYRVSAESEHGPVQVKLAVTPVEKGLALFQAGAYRDALPWLDRAFARDRDPTAAACRQICMAIMAPDDGQAPKREFSGLAAYVNRPFTEAALPALYGVSSAYLRGLPYYEWPASELGRGGFRQAAAESGAGDALSEAADVVMPDDSTNGIRWVRSPLVMLPGGCYTVQLQCAPGAPLEQAAALDVSLRDAADRPVAPTVRLTLSPTRFGVMENLSIPLQKPGQPAAVRVIVEMTNSLNLVVHGLSIRPDPVAGVQAVKDALGALVYGESPRSAAVPANYDLLMAMAAAVESGSRPGRSRPFYLMAALACPNRTDPVEGLVRTSLHIHEDVPADVVRRVATYAATAAQRRIRPADVRFEGGMRLVGFSLAADRLRAGEMLGLRLDWDASRADSRRRRAAVWVHFVDAGDKTIFQGDHGLIEDLVAPRQVRTLSTEDYFDVAVPADIPAGVYRVRVGLWIPTERQRLMGHSDTVPMVKRGVELAEVEIVR